ncbi:cyclic nucleotide-gated ion channel 1-like [Prunus avium]|uniref:Cyclic nucleotide-gated ion channel 1-like n=1 Tax=Prunus avium TaxID=42229 RepID=A0A6P5TE41_PRUAV|nr:cyclic nucleotide-gated ion channel 1-like [Prunus avium]
MSYPRLAKFAKGLALRKPWLSFDFIVEFLAILPVPQVAVTVLFFEVKGSGYFYERSIINLVLLFQYLPRIFRIYLHASSIKKIWIKGVLNFYLYILASHMLGAIWYFLAIQRETICWHEACKSTEGCKAIHYCDEIDTSRSTNNITFVNEKCPINPANAKLFDFGIFLEALQSVNTAGQINFSTKFFYTLWWGFRNMSNYGTDLKTSNYWWENCFAILISAIGLLLFSYLIGNVQTCMQQLTSTNPSEVEKGKEGEIRCWMSRNCLLEYKIEVKNDAKHKSKLARQHVR